MKGLLVTGLLVILETGSAFSVAYPKGETGVHREDVKSPVSAPSGGVKELSILRDPFTVTLLNYMVNPKTIAPSGASGSNIAYERGDAEWVKRFDVADQRHCWQAVARGITEGDTFYIERGLKAIEYAFVHQHEDGSFGRSRWFETMGFLEAAARCYLLIELSRYNDEYLPRIEAYVPKMKRAAEWLVETKDKEYREEWRKAPNYANIVAATGVAFQLMGRITGNNRFAEMGRETITVVLDNQRENGVFPEAGGFDSSYQAVTLWRLMIYLIYSEDEGLNCRIKRALEKGWEWEESRITSAGEVITDGNSRTGLDGETWRGKKKGVNYLEVCMSSMYRSYIGGDEEMKTLAEKVLDHGLYLYKREKGKN